MQAAEDGPGSQVDDVPQSLAPVPRGRGDPPTPYLLHGGQALELGAAEVLLLKSRRLQHEVLLLCCIHLLQVLRRGVGLPVQGLLDHLAKGTQREGRGVRVSHGRGRAGPSLNPRSGSVGRLPGQSCSSKLIWSCLESQEPTLKAFQLPTPSLGLCKGKEGARSKVNWGQRGQGGLISHKSLPEVFNLFWGCAA